MVSGWRFDLVAAGYRPRSPSRTRKRRARKAGRGAGSGSGIRARKRPPESGSGSPQAWTARPAAHPGVSDKTVLPAPQTGTRPRSRPPIRRTVIARFSASPSSHRLRRGCATDSGGNAAPRRQMELPMAPIGKGYRRPPPGRALPFLPGDLCSPALAPCHNVRPRQGARASAPAGERSTRTVRPDCAAGTDTPGRKSPRTVPCTGSVQCRTGAAPPSHASRWPHPSTRCGAVSAKGLARLRRGSMIPPPLRSFASGQWRYRQ